MHISTMHALCYYELWKWNITKFRPANFFRLSQTIISAQSSIYMREGRGRGWKEGGRGWRERREGEEGRTEGEEGRREGEVLRYNWEKSNYLGICVHSLLPGALSKWKPWCRMRAMRWHPSKPLTPSPSSTFLHLFSPHHPHSSPSTLPHSSPPPLHHDLFTGSEWR